MARIDIICNDGSPIGVGESSINGEGRTGVGGAELALLTICRGLHDRGHEVRIYNGGKGSVFQHYAVNDFRSSDDRDVLVIFRSPNHRIDGARGKKIWWSCDQHTVSNFYEFSKKVDKIIGISQFHSNYFANIYGIRNMVVIDIPVRDFEYPDNVEKVKNSCIFTSVPDRGLMALIPLWDEIVRQVPDASLTITSDWSLWSGNDVSRFVLPYKLAWAGKPNVTYKSAVRREELIQIQSKAQFHLYPCIYEELYCISVAESQVAGAIPITSRIGALETTNRFGYKIDGHPRTSEFQAKFIDTVVRLMKVGNIPDITKDAKKEFGFSVLMDKWEKEILE